jgi:predicted flap endonuclease-1-like 5' DNA nuclease
MTALNLQVALLMLAAYLLGAIVACVIRRALFSGSRASRAATRGVDPLPEYVQPTPHARRFGRTPAQAPAAPPAPARTPSTPAPAPAATPAATAAPQDLENIRGIDAAIAAGLARLGITRYEQIAAWRRPDVQQATKALALAPGQINAANWIEQAQVLAKGESTLYAARRARGERASAGPTPDEGDPPAPSAGLPRPMSSAGVAADVVAPAPAPVATQPAPPRTAPPATPPQVEQRAAFANRPQEPQPAAGAAVAYPIAGAAPSIREAQPIRPKPPADRDNLQRIGHIDAALEAKLNEAGIVRYAQIAGWSTVDVDRFDAALGCQGAIARENWIEQAHILSRGGDTAYSRQIDGGSAPVRPPMPPVPPPAARPIKAAPPPHQSSPAPAVAPPVTGSVDPHDLGTLRSVRPQATGETEPGPEAAGRVAAQDKVPRAPPDDLKRIRGIGVLIEKRLFAMGVTSYEEIANWTAADIDRVSQSLEFKGRIERENWIEQARILASGGATEFSRRFDRGETDASRASPP